MHDQNVYWACLQVICEKFFLLNPLAKYQKPSILQFPCVLNKKKFISQQLYSINTEKKIENI